MKKVIDVLIISVLIFGCSSSSDEQDAPVSKEGIHLTSNDGLNPMSLIKENNQYTLFYSSEDTWKYAVSNNLIHWTDSSTIDIPSDAIGDVIFDVNNTSGLSQSPFIAIFNDGDMQMKYTSAKDQPWKQGELKLPPSVSGNPKVMRDGLGNNWIMTLTKEQSVVILSSENLIDWTEVTRIEMAEPATAAELTKTGDRWVLLTSGDNSFYQVLDTDFIPISDAKSLVSTFEKTSVATTKIEERNLAVFNIGKKTLSIPKELTLTQDSILSINNVVELNSQAITKRRSKLESLKGQGSSRFQFYVENYDSDMEILIQNEQGESVKITISKPNNSLTIDKTNNSNAFDGSVEKVDWTSTSQTLFADLIVDYSVVELSLNNGEVQLSIPVQPVFIYDQVNLMADDNKYDARAVLYSLIEEPEPAKPNI